MSLIDPTYGFSSILHTKTGLVAAEVVPTLCSYFVKNATVCTLLDSSYNLPSCDVGILLIYFPSPSYLHCAALFSSYLHCAVIFLFSPSLFTLRCYLPLLSFFIALLSLSLQCDSKKEASDTGNIQQEEEDDAHTRNEDDAQVSRIHTREQHV